MSIETLRIGIVGAGENSDRHHLPKLQALAGVEVVAVCNSTPASSAKVAETWRIPTTHADWRSLVRDSSVDAVVIGTWPNLHCNVAVAALEAGKHVLCEGRMAMNLREAVAMRDAARLHPRLVAQLVPSAQTLGVDATVQRLIASGYLGTLISVDVESHRGTFPDREAPMHWREDAERSGRNIMTLGIWYESLMRWVGEASRVMAMAKTTIPLRRDSDGRMRAVRIPDHLDVLAEMACGAQLRLQASNVIGLAQRQEATLCGSEGILRVTGHIRPGGVVEGATRGDDALQPIQVPPEEAGTWRVEEEFVGAIRGDEPIVLTDFDSGVKYMEFTEAVWLSLSNNTAISLPLAQ